MRRKLDLLVLLSTLILSVLFLNGCDFLSNNSGNQKDEHEHTLSEEWNKDDIYHWKICSSCYEILFKNEHSWDSGTVSVQPTETTEGERVYRCMICGKEKVESIPKLVHQHTFSNEWDSDDTYHWHSATCSHTNEVSEKSEHSFDDGIITKEATESETGIIQYTCSICGKVKEEIIPVLEHTHVYNKQVESNQFLASEATCIEAKKYYYSCECGEKGVDTFSVGESLGHSFTNYIFNNDATCSADGTKTAKCDRCDEKNTVTAEGTKLDHTFSSLWTSNDEYHWHAATCEHTNETSDKEIHSWDDGVIETEPTDGVDGIISYTCSICGYQKRETISVSSLYTIKFVLYDDYELSSVSVMKGKIIATSEIPTPPEIDGKVFANWDKDLSTITDDATVKAVYRDLLLVSFYDYDGSLVDSVYVDLGESAITLIEPSRVGYKFVGWDDDLNNVTDNMDVYAVYEKLYLVKFVDYDGNTIKQEYVEKDGNATPPQVESTRIEYQFDGWDKEYNNIKEDTIIVAKYILKSYNVNFLMPNGKVIDSQTVPYGFAAISPEVDNYYLDESSNVIMLYGFTGWDKAFNNITSDLQVNAIYDTNVSEPIILVTSKEVNRGTESVTVSVHLIGNFKSYGLNICLSFDDENAFGLNESNIEKKLVGATEESLQVDEKKKTINYTWVTANDTGMLKVNGEMEVLKITFSLSQLQTLKTYNLTFTASTYFVGENLTKDSFIPIDGTIVVK